VSANAQASAARRADIAARYFAMLGPRVMNESPTSRKRSV